MSNPPSFLISTHIYCILMSTKEFFQWNPIPFSILYIIPIDLFSTGLYKIVYTKYRNDILFLKSLLEQRFLISIRESLFQFSNQIHWHNVWQLSFKMSKFDFQSSIRYMIEPPVPRYFTINEATGNITVAKELNTSLETTFQVSLLYLT